MGAIKELTNFKKSREESLRNEGFQISREFSISCTQYPQGEFLVDDVSKKFAIRYLESKRTNNPFALYKYTPVLRVYKYSDLGPFELSEDGNAISQGRGAATALGGVAFGLVGAMVGSSGKRKIQNTCTSLCVNVAVNDLQSPQLMIEFMNSEVKKDSGLYKEKLQQAQEFIGVLQYIAANS